MSSAVAYVRVSTDDKGQDPARQLDVIRPWCEHEGVVVVDVVVDQGSSASKTSPFERPRFVDACERAKAAGASAIVVECADRFSRQGAKLDAWAEVELERRYGLRLLRADKSLADHGGMAAAVTDTIHAEGAAAWVRGHASKVRTGMARARREGRHLGRPLKLLTSEELALVDELRAAGRGWRSIALALSRARGAFELADPAARRSRTVSHMHVRRVVERRHAVTKRDA